MTDHWSEVGEPCRLGYQEYDGARYCHEHGGFLEPGTRSLRCNRYGVAPEMDLPGMWSQSDFLGGSTCADSGPCPTGGHPMTTPQPPDTPRAADQWADLRALEAAATPGPWTVEEHPDGRVWTALREQLEQAERQVRAGLALADEWTSAAEGGRLAAARQPDHAEHHEAMAENYDYFAGRLRAALSGVSGPTTEGASE